jgi:SAM-dependent methyltransferase
LNEDLSRFRDPVHNKPLRREGDVLISVDGQSYPIVDSIPRFVPPDNYAADFGAQWNRFPQTQLDSHTGLTISEDRLAGCFGVPLSAIKGKRVLEAGSGAGRFTEVLLKHGAILDTFDYSAAVAANAKNNGRHAFALAQADIRAIPFPRQSYDFVACVGVLQHTPDTEQSIEKLWEMVAPGGRLVIDHYGRNFWLSLPPPLGDAEKLYRAIILRLPASKRFGAVKRLVDFWFPVYWATRKSRWARRILSRVSGIHFYFLDHDLKTRERHYEWSLLDTHDGMTDAFKRYRDVASIRTTLEKLGAVNCVVRKGGNGVEAWCDKPN